jgi:hypothetical protein
MELFPFVIPFFYSGANAVGKEVLKQVPILQSIFLRMIQNSLSTIFSKLVLVEQGVTLKKRLKR